MVWYGMVVEGGTMGRTCQKKRIGVDLWEGLACKKKKTQNRSCPHAKDGATDYLPLRKENKLKIILRGPCFLMIHQTNRFWNLENLKL